MKTQYPLLLALFVAACGGSGGGGQPPPDPGMPPVSYQERMRVISMPFARTDHAAITLTDGRVLIVGGLDESKLAARPMYVFDPSSETFTSFGSLGTAGPLGFAAIALKDNNALVVGGVPGSAGTNAVLIKSGNVTPTTGQPHTLRVWGTATGLMDGKVLIAGGLLATADDNGNTIGISATPDRTAEAYDPATGTFTVLPGLLTAGRYRHTATATTDGRVLIYGGITESGEPAPPELYDPATSTFIVQPAAESGVRANHAAVKTSNGDIWIVGGEDPNGSALTSVIRFDHATRTLSHALDLATARTLLGAAALPDTRILVAGGGVSQTSSHVADSSELITTATALAHPGPQLTTARRSNTITTLSNGKALIAGGVDQNGNPLATAEIYE